MLHRSFVIAALALLFLAACRDLRTELDATRHVHTLGDDSITVVVLRGDQDGFSYINLHENETTSIGAAIEHVHRTGGRVVHLEQAGERNIRFSMGDSLFVFDPNRIFTDLGIRLTLEQLSEYSPAAHREVRSFRTFLLDILNIAQEQPVITVHNNTDGEYSILRYADGGTLSSEAMFVYVAHGEDPDDFFFVTEPEWFSAIRAAEFNVVVQDNLHVTDDGSLSVWCGHNEIPYVNVEAEHGHFEIQVRMLDFLERMLTE
ncbi:MAG: hypothetical protein ACOCTG_03600 [Bacteroidota bacterium]